MAIEYKPVYNTSKIDWRNAWVREGAKWYQVRSLSERDSFGGGGGGPTVHQRIDSAAEEESNTKT